MLRFRTTVNGTFWQVTWKCKISVPACLFWTNQYGNVDHFPGYLSILCICSHSQDVSTTEGLKRRISVANKKYQANLLPCHPTFLEKSSFKLFFKWMDSCLMFGHLIRPKGGKKGEVFNIIFLCKILTNISTILGNSLSNILAIPSGLALVGRAQPSVSVSCARDTLCPVRSKAIKWDCKCSSKNTSRMLLR